MNGSFKEAAFDFKESSGGNLFWKLFDSYDSLSSSSIEDEDVDGLKVNLDYMAQIFNKTDGEKIPASGRRAPNIFSKTENLFFFIFHPSYIMNQVLNQKMSVNEIQEKCPNLLKTAKNQTIYYIEECCWGTDWQNKFKKGFSFYSSQTLRSKMTAGHINVGD